MIVLIAAIIDTATNRNFWVFPRIMGYAFFFFNVSLAIILANSFVKLNEQVEDLNRNLEKKVEDRTLALHDSLFQLQNLKEKQRWRLFFNYHFSSNLWQGSKIKFRN